MSCCHECQQHKLEKDSLQSVDIRFLKNLREPVVLTQSDRQMKGTENTAGAFQLDFKHRP